MTVNLNTSVFAIKTADDGHRMMEMTEDFGELALVLRRLVRQWCDVRERNDAVYASARFELGALMDIYHELGGVLDCVEMHDA